MFGIHSCEISSIFFVIVKCKCVIFSLETRFGRFDPTCQCQILVTCRFGSPESNSKPKYHIFIFCEDKNHTQNFTMTNSKHFNIYRNGKHILVF